jgi:hypothetical protein
VTETGFGLVIGLLIAYRWQLQLLITMFLIYTIYNHSTPLSLAVGAGASTLPAPAVSAVSFSV